MSGPTELLVLRLGLIAVIFVFVAVVAVSLRGSIRPAAVVSSRPSKRTWKLVVMTPADSGLPRGMAFPLAGTMLIGRDPRAGIVVPDVSVSTRHATIERVGSGWRVVDLGSTNGTLVNGQAVSSAGALLRGDERISVGAVVFQLGSD